MSALSAPHFHNDDAAYAYVEARIWPEGPVCPHCGGCDRIGKMGGKSTRVGAYKCYQCRKPFTVKVGTIFEDSKVAMRLWLQAMYLIAGSKKGISSNQLHRTLGVTLKTAWFMSHRIREAMRSGDLSPFGSDGGAVVRLMKPTSDSVREFPRLVRAALIRWPSCRWLTATAGRFARFPSVLSAPMKSIPSFAPTSPKKPG